MDVGENPIGYQRMEANLKWPILLLKGIQCVHDALKAVEYKCDGIVVSTHAG